MGRERKTLLTLAILMLATSAVLQPYAAWLNREKYPHEDGRKPIPGLQEVPEGTLADLAGFVTHLPIVVLEFDAGSNPGKHAVWNSRKQYAEPAETDPFAFGRFSLIDNGVRNTLADKPAVETRIRSRYRGLTSLNFPKKQYLLRALNDDGTPRPVDLLGMGAADSWILNISHIDKSLLRNYLCLNVASRVMGYAPETRFCEAFRKRGDRYEYIGVYLLMEPVAYGPDRVDITKYDPRHAECAFILRRDRFQEDTVILDTYATVRRWSAGFLEVKYPGQRRLRPRSVRYIEEPGSRLERALYSEEKDRFLR
ncbi:MAG: CotH kinase family protein, partial [Planctomycetes bacterium]|nr:CotH kinase family protein [Planctomycetota bacterium]